MNPKPFSVFIPIAFEDFSRGQASCTRTPEARLQTWGEDTGLGWT